MKNMLKSMVLLALASSSALAVADPWKDESGKGRHGREFKQEYWDGNCKVEKKWEKGEYKEERKCKRRDRDDEPQRYGGHYYGGHDYGEYRERRPAPRQGYYPSGGYYDPNYGRHERRAPAVDIDVRIR